MSLLPKSIHRCRRYPTKFNSGRDIPSKGGIQIKRRDPSGEEKVLKVDLGDILSGKESDFILQEGDVIVVKESFF